MSGSGMHWYNVQASLNVLAPDIRTALKRVDSVLTEAVAKRVDDKSEIEYFGCYGMADPKPGVVINMANPK